MNTYMTIRYMDELRERGYRISLEEAGNDTPLWQLIVKDKAGAVAFSTQTTTAEHAFEKAKALFGAPHQPDRIIVEPERVRFTHAALGKLDAHYPDISARAAAGLLARSTVVEREAIYPLLGRDPRRVEPAPSVYLLPPERKGVIVLQPDRIKENALACVTYIAFVDSQEREAKRLWPAKGAA